MAKENWYALAETIDRAHLGNFAEALRSNVETPEDLVHATVAVADCAVNAMLKELDVKPELMYLISVLVFRKLNDLEDGFTSVTNYNDMLDPTNKRLFEKVLNQEVFEDLQQKAQELLDSTPDAHPAFKKHWEMIVSGRVPFGYSIAEEVFATDPANYVRKEPEEQPVEEPVQEEMEVEEVPEEPVLDDALPDDVCPECGCTHCCCE